MKDETFTVAGRTFVLVPEHMQPNTAWTFKEVLPDGSRVDPDDVMGCAGPKGFVKFHVKSSLGER